tara:strand:- start:411 stop:578 length:168 start_codon:yes stop_codon:yes gene_type:complete
MNKYELEVREIRYAFYEIEADNEDEAIDLFDGGEPVSAQDYHDDIINCRLIEDES